MRVSGITALSFCTYPLHTEGPNREIEVDQNFKGCKFLKKRWYCDGGRVLKGNLVL